MSSPSSRRSRKMRAIPPRILPAARAGARRRPGGKAELASDVLDSESETVTIAGRNAWELGVRLAPAMCHECFINIMACSAGASDIGKILSKRLPNN